MPRRAIPVLALVLLAGCSAAPERPQACLGSPPVPDPGDPRAGMVRLEGGAFAMGAGAMRPEEGPARTVRVGAFWIDRTEVTNAAFARFVAATGYRTLAERNLDARDYPELTPEQRRPASLVFVGADPPDRNDPGAWWRVVPGADWRHPEGPGSDIRGRESWPVTHVAWEDAKAYAAWLGRDLPTEAEWEYAARGGLVAQPYVWGGRKGEVAQRANTWQGPFPAADAGADGYKAKAAPVGCYPPNGFGLHDMAGNVWEWTADWYRPGLEPAGVLETGGPPEGRAFDPDDPGRPKHVLKGGSYLCADDYCFRYRPPARSAGPPDSGASHIGFRTVLREPS